jgi:hypothetical protein
MGGNAAATFDEVVSRLARVKAVYKGYGSAREAVLLNGRFILQQLAAADDARRGVTASSKDKGKSAAGASEWAFYKGLEAEVRTCQRDPPQLGYLPVCPWRSLFLLAALLPVAGRTKQLWQHAPCPRS